MRNKLIKLGNMLRTVFGTCMYSINYFKNVIGCLEVVTPEFSRSSNRIMAFELFAICNLINGFKTSNSLEEVLEALTLAGEERKIDRFSSIVEGLLHNSVQLQVGSCLSPILFCNFSY